MASRLITYAPRDRWLALLAQGWRFGSPYGLPVADVMAGSHGTFSVMMWRPDA